MSRLADMLSRMDRAARPAGPGEVPRLTDPEPSTAKWQRGVMLVAVVALLTAGAAAMLRPRSVAVTAVVTPLPTQRAQSHAAADERFVTLLGEGLEAAKRGALGESAGLLRKALELNPADAGAWNSLGVVLVGQGETGRGVDAFSHALRLNPNHAEAHRNLAVALDREGRSGEAVAHYRDFLRLATADHPARDEVRRRVVEVSPSKAKE
jgi:Flp pilus assembly protein TadD